LELWAVAGTDPTPLMLQGRDLIMHAVNKTRELTGEERRFVESVMGKGKGPTDHWKYDGKDGSIYYVANKEKNNGDNKNGENWELVWKSIPSVYYDFETATLYHTATNKPFDAKLCEAEKSVEAAAISVVQTSSAALTPLEETAKAWGTAWANALGISIPANVPEDPLVDCYHCVPNQQRKHPNPPRHFFGCLLCFRHGDGRGKLKSSIAKAPGPVTLSFAGYTATFQSPSA
jgi:hypothetical protein